MSTGQRVSSRIEKSRGPPRDFRGYQKKKPTTVKKSGECITTDLGKIGKPKRGVKKL